jgi:hypothetical protein
MNFFNIAVSSDRLYCGVMKPWQTCPLVSGVGKQDKRSIMPVPANTGIDWG